MKRAVALALAGAGMAVAAPAAHAQVLIKDPEFYRSKQRWALELRFGPYYPDVDAEFSGDPALRPHRFYFGKKRRLMSQIELDYSLFQQFGTASVGVGVGYFRETARAFIETAEGLSEQRSNDRTRLTLVPVSLLGVYRFDVAARRWRVPIVPYGKLGLNYTIWNISDGSGKVATSASPKGRGRGGTAGWQAAVGASFLLDVLDPGAARALDGEVGVNHTSLFLELTHFDGSGFGKKGALRVGDTTWMAGLMFEF